MWGALVISVVFEFDIFCDVYCRKLKLSKLLKLATSRSVDMLMCTISALYTTLCFRKCYHICDSL